MNSQPSSPIPMRPNTLTPPRSTTPSDLFWHLQTTLIKRTMGLIFNDSILLNHWNTEMKEVLKTMIEDMIKLKEMLALTIRDVKYYLPTSQDPPAEQLAIVTHMIRAMEKFEEAQIIADCFLKYLKPEQ